MTATPFKEGNLEAPTRHPLDWQNPEFYDQDKCFAEIERIFDICHGCRRCVNLCNAFPTLFDLVDNGKTGEVDGIEKSKYWDVVDQCYLCDMCYMTKCPYVPPHAWNLDFPHTMLRAKSIKFKQGKVKLRDKVLSSTDALGKLASIPVVVEVVNAANKNSLARKALESTLGVAQKRWLPEYSSKKFRSHATTNTQHSVTNGERTPGKVAIYSTCYIQFNEPGIGHDLIQILDHNAIVHQLVEKEVCCGMPKLELGDLESVAKNKALNIPVLAELARKGYAILSPVPSCTLMYKQELPLMFPDDEDVQLVKKACFDPFEYLVLRGKDGLLRTDFKKSLGKISYHIPCHSRVQNMGNKTEEMLKMIPDTSVNTVARCAGHDGTWGVKSEYYAISMKIGKPVFTAMAANTPNYIASDCAIAGRHILQGISEQNSEHSIKKQHPLTLLRIAYGLTSKSSSVNETL